jgi:hypothetical protein
MNPAATITLANCLSSISAAAWRSFVIFIFFISQSVFSCLAWPTQPFIDQKSLLPGIKPSVSAMYLGADGQLHPSQQTSLNDTTAAAQRLLQNAVSPRSSFVAHRHALTHAGAATGSDLALNDAARDQLGEPTGAHTRAPAA